MPKSKIREEEKNPENVGELFEENVRLKEALSTVTLNLEKVDGSQDLCIKEKSLLNRFCGSINWRTLIVFLILVVCIIGLFSYILATKKIEKKIPVASKYAVSSSEQQKSMSCFETESKKTFPDLEYALYGYNSLRGYPLAVGHDPGLTHPIFTHDYSNKKQTADCLYQVPKGYILAPDVSCVTSFTSTIARDSHQYSSMLSGSVSASGGGWGVSFSASASYQKHTSEMSASESVFIFSKAKCNYYFAMLDEYIIPPFSPSFLKTIKTLKTERDIFNFFEYYGTHYQKYTLFGAKYVFEHKMSKSDFQSYSSSSKSLSVEASYSGLVSVSASASISKEQSAAVQKFRQKVETKTISIGSAPPENSQSTTWAASVKDNPVPVEYKLESIEDLFTKKYMKQLQNFKDFKDFNFTALHEKVKKAKSNYCKHLLSKGEVNNCKELKSFKTFYEIGLGANTFTSRQTTKLGCQSTCLEDIRCVAADYHTSNKHCYLYKGDKRVSGNQTQEYTRRRAVKSTEKKITSYISIDSLKILDQLFRIENTAFKSKNKRSTSGNVINEQECYLKCKNDTACSAFSFISKASLNCLLISERSITDNSLEYKIGAITVFSPREERPIDS